MHTCWKWASRFSLLNGLSKFVSEALDSGGYLFKDNDYKNTLSDIAGVCESNFVKITALTMRLNSSVLCTQMATSDTYFSSTEWVNGLYRLWVFLGRML